MNPRNLLLNSLITTTTMPKPKPTPKTSSPSYATPHTALFPKPQRNQGLQTFYNHNDKSKTPPVQPGLPKPTQGPTSYINFTWGLTTPKPKPNKSLEQQDDYYDYYDSYDAKKSQELGGEDDYYNPGNYEEQPKNEYDEYQYYGPKEEEEEYKEYDDYYYEERPKRRPKKKPRLKSILDILEHEDDHYYEKPRRRKKKPKDMDDLISLVKEIGGRDELRRDSYRKRNERRKKEKIRGILEDFLYSTPKPRDSKNRQYYRALRKLKEVNSDFLDRNRSWRRVDASSSLVHTYHAPDHSHDKAYIKTNPHTHYSHDHQSPSSYYRSTNKREKEIITKTQSFMCANSLPPSFLQNF
jgi:hypothetical protein